MRSNIISDFDEMVEALEENEDMVECKECFDLFSKSECEKSDIGFICPNCKNRIAAAPRMSTAFEDPYSCYTQEFPEVSDYDPNSVTDYEVEPSLGDALGDLIKDEYEAIDGYEVADEKIQHAAISEDDKDEILDTLDHIKEEEEEHIDELKELCPECDPVAEEGSEKLEEAIEVPYTPTEGLQVYYAHYDFTNELGMVEAPDEDTAYDIVCDHFCDQYHLKDIYIDKLEDAELKDLTVDQFIVPPACVAQEALTEAETPDLPEEEPEAEPGEEPEKDADGSAEAKDSEEDEEDSEKESEEETDEVVDLDSAYEAALEVANEKGVGQVFGYATEEDETFVAIDLFDVDDPDAAEEDLRAVYDNVKFAYVAYPTKNLEEALLEGVQLNEAGFLSNLFTKENETLDAFFTNKFKVKTGNNTEGPLPWAAAEKIAASKTDDTAVIIANTVQATPEVKRKWPIEIVNKLCGKDIQMVTYDKGKPRSNGEVSKLLKQLKAAMKGMDVANKNSSSTTTYNDPYGRTSLTDPVVDSDTNPKAVSVVKTIRRLFDKFTVVRGLSHATGGVRSSTTGEDIQLTSSGYVKEFDTFKEAIAAATTASTRKPTTADFDLDEIPEGALTIVEIYGHIRQDFDADLIRKLDKYAPRPDEVGLLEEAANAGGPVHLFTFNSGKAIKDVKCTAISKYIQYEANIIEDLQDAGIDPNGEPGEGKKSEQETNPESNEEDADLNLNDDENENPIEKVKKMLGEKKPADGYTPESYKKYEAAYNKIDAWIEGLKNPKAVTQEKIDGLRQQAESRLVAVSDDDPNLEDDGEDSPKGTSSDLEKEKDKLADALLAAMPNEAEYTEESWTKFEEFTDKLFDEISNIKDAEGLKAYSDVVDRVNKAVTEILKKRDGSAEDSTGSETGGKLKSAGIGTAHNGDEDTKKKLIRAKFSDEDAGKLLRSVAYNSNFKTDKDLETLYKKIKDFLHTEYKSEFVFEAYKRKLIRECGLAEEEQTVLAESLTEVYKQLRA